MTTLAANKQRTYEETGYEAHEDREVIADDIVYEGAATSDDAAGRIKPLVTNTVFAGFALRKADNAGGAAGAERVRLRTKGHIVLDVATVASVADENEVVYATDDDTFTLSAAGNAVAIGKISRWILGTRCVVAFEAAAERSI